MKQLLPIPFVTPALAGLNKAQEGNTQSGALWALEAKNCYFDSAQRLASRKGWVQTAAALGGSPSVEQVFEYIKADGTTNVVFAANNKLYTGTASYTDVTGALTPTANNWQFVNFMDKVMGFQQSHTPIVWNGTGNFAAITPASGSLPTGNAACAAFGRIFAVDADGYTIKYCGLLDETNWGAAGSGSINMRNVWTNGSDKVVGIYAYGPTLAVFGERHIVLWADATTSTAGLGLNPATMYVADVIAGTGLAARDTVQRINSGDLLYLSYNGLQSLQRAIVQKNNPVETLDSQVKDYLYSYVSAETTTKIRSVFSLVDRAYLLILPTASRIFCYDTLFPLQDGRLRVTEWVYTTGLNPRCAVYRRDGSMLFGVSGKLGQYTGYYDDGSTSYRMVYASAHMSGNTVQTQDGTLENKTKILKHIGTVLYSAVSATPVVKWGFDFNGLNYSSPITLTGGNTPEYGTAEYGANGTYDATSGTAVAGVDVAEYGGYLTLTRGRAPSSNSGRWLQIGLEVQIAGGAFAVQEIDAYVKVGRMV